MPEGFVPIVGCNWGGVLPSGRRRIGAAHRPAPAPGAREQGALPRCVRPSGEGRRQRQAKVQDEPRRDRPCPERSFLPEAAAGGARSAGRTEARSADIGAGGAALDLALAREALRNPTPSRRRHQRGCSRAHDNAFAGGAVCLELGSPCLFCQTGLRLSGHCGAGWRWTAGALRWGGGAAVWSRPVGCGKGCPG